MSEFITIQNLLQGSFNVLNGLPDYISIEELEGMDFNLEDLENKLGYFILLGKKMNLSRLSVLIKRSSKHYLHLSNTLIQLGFEKFASRVEVLRNLEDIEDIKSDHEWRSLADSTLSEDEFKGLWERCMVGSDNAASPLKIEEHFKSVKSELGADWRKSCLAIYEEGKPIGIVIPHIEPGTISEGRLFYFGLVPGERGKGKSALLHHQALVVLKQMGATYYIGGTHESNLRMQKVFLRNGCLIKDHTESYYKYFH